MPRAVAGYERSPIELGLWVPVSDWKELAEAVGPEGPLATVALHIDAAREVAADQLIGLSGLSTGRG